MVHAGTFTLPFGEAMTPDEIIVMEVERELAEMWAREWASLSQDERADILIADESGAEKRC
jgi:hypothetical protein